MNPVRIAPGPRIEQEKFMIRNFYALKRSVYVAKNCSRCYFFSCRCEEENCYYCFAALHFNKLGQVPFPC